MSADPPDNSTGSTLDWAAARARLAASERGLREADQPNREQLLAIWRARAEALGARHADVAAEAAERLAGEQMVVFYLAGERYGVPVEHVLEIQPIDELTYVPNTPAHIAGILIVRGRVVTLLDLRALFDLPRQGLTETSRVIVAQGAGLQVGLLADEVLAVTAVPVSGLEAPLAHLAGARASYLRGVTGDLTALLDIDALLGDERLHVRDEVV